MSPTPAPVGESQALFSCALPDIPQLRSAGSLACASLACAHVVQWRDLPTSRSPSRAQPQGGAWFMAVVPATFLGRSDSVERLEFCVVNGQKKVSDMHSC